MNSDSEGTTAKLIRSIDHGLHDLNQDRSFIVLLVPSLVAEVDNVRKSLTDWYSKILKQIALGDDQGAENDLCNLLSRITTSRLGLLSEAAETATDRIYRIIRNPFWLGERNTYLEAIELVRTTLRNVESEDPNKALLQLVSSIQDVLKLERRMEGEERRAQFRLPIQVVFWGLPIIVGIWISGKFSSIQNLIILGLLFGIVIITFSAVKFRILSRINIHQWFRRSIRMIPSQATTFVQIFFAMFMIALFLTPIINDIVVQHRMKATFGPLPTLIARGAEIRVPYRVYYDHQLAALGVKVYFSAPGIIEVDRKAEFNALSSSRPKVGMFQIRVPDDIPPGLYLFELRVSFTALSASRIPFFRKHKFYIINRSMEVEVE